MRLVKFIGYLLFRYYSEGRWGDRSTAFFRAKITMTMFVFIHLMQFAVIFDVPTLIFPSKSSDILTKKLYPILILLPIYLTFHFLLNKKDIEKLEEEFSYEWDKVFNASAWLVTYAILSVAMLIVLLVMKN